MGGQVVSLPKECSRRHSVQLGRLAEMYVCTCVDVFHLWSLGVAFRSSRKMEGAISWDMAYSSLS